VGFIKSHLIKDQQLIFDQNVFFTFENRCGTPLVGYCVPRQQTRHDASLPIGFEKYVFKVLQNNLFFRVFATDFVADESMKEMKRTCLKFFKYLQFCQLDMFELNVSLVT
jgi:hypothetical protein